MQLQVTIPEFEVMFSQIMDFQTEETSPFWSKPLFHFILSWTSPMHSRSRLQTETAILSKRCKTFTRN